jgi:hypothetical protein
MFNLGGDDRCATKLDSHLPGLIRNICSNRSFWHILFEGLLNVMISVIVVVSLVFPLIILTAEENGVGP